MRRRLTWLDVFTSTPLAGNQLAVVHDADDLDDATMQAFARETRLSETTFVQSPSASGADYRNRIWGAMDGEMTFAGHPSLGTAVAVARARGQDKARYVQQTPAGLQPVEVQIDGDHARASMLQEPPHVDGDEGVARARGFFLDPAGITEDPATGSAAGPLLAHLRARDGIDELSVHQGVEMGRPSRIDCAWADDRPRVSGDVVVLADGDVLLGQA